MVGDGFYWLIELLPRFCRLIAASRTFVVCTVLYLPCSAHSPPEKPVLPGSSPLGPAGAARQGSFRIACTLLEGGHTVYQAVGNLFANLCTVLTAVLWGQRFTPDKNVNRRYGSAATLDLRRDSVVTSRLDLPSA